MYTENVGSNFKDGVFKIRQRTEGNAADSNK